MKISPIAQGSGVPGASDVGNRTISTDKITRAKAIAAGETPIAVTQTQTDPQIDRAQKAMKAIKMRTQVSPDRVEPVVEQVLETAVEEQSPTQDVSEQAPVVEEPKPLSPQFAALAKAKRALQVKEREIAQREEALKTQNPQGADEIIAKLKANPLSVLQEHGVSYDQLTEAIIANQSGVTPEILALKAELKALKEEFSGQLSQRDTLQEQQVLTQMRKDVEAITSQGEDFEAIREAKAQQQVVDLIHRTFKQTGEILSEHEAAQLVENQLIEEALPFARIKKVQSRLTPAQIQEQVAEQQAQQPGVKTMRTLTNRDTARPLADRRARAIAAFTGTKKG